MDELDFVSYLKREFSFSHGIGIGDDASVSPPMKENMVVTNDIIVEDIHFRRDHFGLDELALKSLAVNISDIVAMGGIPKFYYLGLGFPEGFTQDHMEDFFGGLKRGNQMWHTELAGGDFSRSSQIFISITLIGEVATPVLRSGAKEGDLIGLSGPVGESALGFELLNMGIREGYFVDRHKKVEPVVQNGLILSKFAHSMIDVSDGLLIDLTRILNDSNKGALINYEKIPVSDEMKKTCQDAHLDERKLVLAGGEDYVLLFSISGENEKKLREESIEYSIIGTVKPREFGVKVQNGNLPLEVTSMGYDHFTAGKS